MDIPRSLFFFGERPKKYKVTVHLSISSKGTYAVEAESEAGAKILACKMARIPWYEHPRIVNVELDR